ncbi:MAG: M43 family zinc metalloprotease, partial [Flavobacteriales bacterium]|nr:M43 family zinc metalloprotease [Flavobacteriales bacterium]MDW8410988.1 M43 family zinc metalloprotease [Flavobacteriales bacterium]
MKKILLTTTTVALFMNGTTNVLAQSQEGFRRCATQEMIDKFIEDHPELADEIRALEENAEVEYSGERATKIFPIVFHILHTYSTSDFIPNEQVRNAVRILNEDFQKMNADTNLVVAAFKNLIGNANWEFRLARKDPDGNCTNGITRWFYPLTQDAGEEAKLVAPAWPRNKYINVWVVKGLENGAGGYTYNPSTAQFAPEYDGIIVVNTQFGTGGTSYNTTFARRTLSHEMGHFFNLRHTWGNSNTPGLSSNCNTDDNVSDTPNTIGVDDQTCNTSQVTCGSLDNVQNIMDYASCPIMFTHGQVTRMTNAANSSTAQRNNLSSAANLVATGTQDGYTDTICVPMSDFIASPRTICEGGTVSLQDMSWRGTPTQWNYTLTSGSQSLSATGPNPQVTIPVAGIYDVSLTTTNSAGSNSRTKQNYLAVFPTTPTFSSSHYYDDFENNPISGGHWFTINDDEINGWKETTTASTSGHRSIFVRNGNAIKYSRYSIVSPSYDLSQTSNPYLKFKYAFAKKADDNNDFLKIYISTNCGTTWSLIPPGISASASGSATAPNTSG